MEWGFGFGGLVCVVGGRRFRRWWVWLRSALFVGWWLLHSTLLTGGARLFEERLQRLLALAQPLAQELGTLRFMSGGYFFFKLNKKVKITLLHLSVSDNSLALTAKKFMPDSVAKARAMSVLLHPGGP